MKIINHAPDCFGHWVEYNGCRYKQPYNVRLNDGSEIGPCYPNGVSFHPEKGREIDDSEVTHIQPCTDEELNPVLIDMYGDEASRAKINSEMFASEINETKDLEVTMTFRLENFASPGDTRGLGGFEGLAKQMFEEEGPGIFDFDKATIEKVREVNQ